MNELLRRTVLTTMITFATVAEANAITAKSCLDVTQNSQQTQKSTFTESYFHQAHPAATLSDEGHPYTKHYELKKTGESWRGGEKAEFKNNHFSSKANHNSEQELPDVATFVFSKAKTDEKWMINGESRITCFFPVNTASYAAFYNNSKSRLSIYTDSPLTFILGRNGYKLLPPLIIKDEESGLGKVIDIEPEGSLEIGLVMDFGATSFSSFINTSSKHPSLPLVVVPGGSPDLTRELSDTAKQLSYPGIKFADIDDMKVVKQWHHAMLRQTGVIQAPTFLLNDTNEPASVSFDVPVVVVNRSKLRMNNYVTDRIYLAPRESVNLNPTKSIVRYTQKKELN